MSVTLLGDPTRIRTDLAIVRQCLRDPEWRCPDDVVSKVFELLEECLRDGRPNRVDAMVRTLVKIMERNLEALKKELKVQFPIRDFHAQAALDVVEKQLDSGNPGERNEGVKNVVRMMKHNLERVKAEAVLTGAIEHQQPAIEGSSVTTIHVIEDEGWYGNNAHAKAAEAAALPDSDSA